MTAPKPSCLPCPPEGRSPCPPRQGWGQQHHVRSVPGAASPRELRERKGSPHPWLHLEPTGHLPVSPQRASATAPPLSGAAESSGGGLKVPRWDCNSPGFTTGLPARAQGQSGRCPPPQHPPAPCEMPVQSGTRPCQHHPLPCSPSRHSGARSLGKRMF